MNEVVKSCVDAKINFFDEYFNVPAEIQTEVDAFKRELVVLGEGCSDAAAFEEKYVSTGLSDRFTSIVPKCIPKSRKMTKEEKKQSLKIAKDILVENKEEIAADLADTVAFEVRVATKTEAAKRRREEMIADGTFGEYTRASNMVRDAGHLLGFLKDKFGKK